MRILLIFLLLLFSPTLRAAVWWEPIGPNVFTPYDFIFARTKPGVIYVYSERPFSWSSFGILRSLDGGLNWEKFTSRVQGMRVSAMALDPFNEDRVYALYRNGVDFLRIWSYLAVTEDDGQTWTQLYVWENEPFSAELGEMRTLKMDPHRQGVIYVGNLKYRFRSRDYGHTWEEVEGVSETGIRDIEFHPEEKELVFLAPKAGLFKSIDGGETWIDLSEVMPGGDKVIINPENPNVITFFFFY